MKHFLTSLFAWACIVSCLCAQNITVADAIGQSPTSFLKNNLVSGDGVYIFNVEYAGSASDIGVRSIGTFDANGYDGLGMESGIIMTTGDIAGAVGPNDASNMTMNLWPDVYRDVSIQEMASHYIYNCSTLDFDFVCLNSNISFNYCFGSEEYIEYCCQEVNDLFVFLLTGPDPQTGGETTKNIAMIPNTVSEDHPNGIPVSVNTVNDGSHGNSTLNDCYSLYSDYFIHNETDDETPLEGVQYDGFTDKLVARASVVPCAVYHMHISVCNVGDNAWDSGVFIEGSSFKAQRTETGFSTTTVDTVSGHCPFERSFSLEEEDFETGIVHIKYGGTALQGVDYDVFDEFGHPVDTNAIVVDNTPHTYYIKGLPTADLSQNKTIELYLESQLCPDVPQLVIHDTQQYVLVRGGDVKLADTTIRCGESCFEVEANLVYGDNVRYVWQNLDGTLATGIDNPYAGKSSAMIFESRDYRVIATGGSGCNSDTAIVHVLINAKDIPVGVLELDEAAARVYPNPAIDRINIEAEGLERVEVFSVEGRKVMEHVYSQAHGTVTLSTEGLENGTYGIRVTTATGRSGAKVMVNR